MQHLREQLNNIIAEIADRETELTNDIIDLPAGAYDPDLEREKRDIVAALDLLEEARDLL